MFMAIIYAVPILALSLSVPNGPLYEGTSHTLACNATLPGTVDTDVTVDVYWTLPASSDHVNVMLSPVATTFISTLTLSPLSMSDAGQYSCEATVNSSSQYISTSNEGQSLLETLVSVTGMLAVLAVCINYLYLFQLCLLLMSIFYSLGTLLLVRTIPCGVQLVWWLVWWYHPI